MASRKRPLAESNANFPPPHRQRTLLETKQLPNGRENAVPPSNPHECGPDVATLLQAPAAYDSTGRPAIHWASPQHQTGEPCAPSAQNVARRSPVCHPSLPLGTYQAAYPGGQMAFQPERQRGDLQYSHTGPAPIPHEQLQQKFPVSQSPSAPNHSGHHPSMGLQQHSLCSASGSHHHPTLHGVPSPPTSQPHYLPQQGPFHAPHAQPPGIDHSQRQRSQPLNHINSNFRPYRPAAAAAAAAVFTSTFTSPPSPARSLYCHGVAAPTACAVNH